MATGRAGAGEHRHPRDHRPRPARALLLSLGGLGRTAAPDPDLRQGPQGRPRPPRQKPLVVPVAGCRSHGHGARTPARPLARRPPAGWHRPRTPRGPGRAVARNCRARGVPQGPRSLKRRNMTTKSPPTMNVEEVPIDELRPDPANPRRISDAQLEALTQGIRQFGFVQPVLARREDKTVIGGHQRLTAARRLGYKTVPVYFLDVSLEQARLLNLSLNKISGEWDQDLLARLLADLKPVEEVDLSLSGF